MSRSVCGVGQGSKVTLAPSEAVHTQPDSLRSMGLKEAKVVSTPMDLSVKLEKDDGVSKGVDSVTYQSIVGGLMYAAIATRPDISFAVGVLSKFNSKPYEAHLTAAKWVIRYLKGTVDVALKYCKTVNGTLIGYSDANWAGDIDDRHSTTGNLFLMASGAISWMSKKQTTVALSTAEADLAQQLRKLSG